MIWWGMSYKKNLILNMTTLVMLNSFLLPRHMHPMHLVLRCLLQTVPPPGRLLLSTSDPPYPPTTPIPPLSIAIITLVDVTPCVNCLTVKVMRISTVGRETTKQTIRPGAIILVTLLAIPMLLRLLLPQLCWIVPGTST